MDLRGFLDAAYALFIEEWQRIGVPLLEALEKMPGMKQGATKSDTPTQTVSNDRALAQLQSIMQQAGGMPG
jgi:hypothetical protein